MKLQAGDAIFIPGGYWHQISSVGGTMAINIWFESKISDLVVESDMSEFYLTRLLQSKVADQAQKILAAIPLHPQLVATNAEIHQGM